MGSVPWRGNAPACCHGPIPGHGRRNRQLSDDLCAVGPIRWPSAFLPGVDDVSKRTFQPNNRRRAKTHGFRLRMRTRAGRAILTGRRRKGRRELSA